MSGLPQVILYCIANGNNTMAMILGPFCFNCHLSKNRAGKNFMVLNLVRRATDLQLIWFRLG